MKQGQQKIIRSPLPWSFPRVTEKVNRGAVIVQSLFVVLILVALGAGTQVFNWQDGFEPYSAGAPAPSPRQGDGNGDVIVDSASSSAQKAMQLSGSGSCWEGLCDREMPVTNALVIGFAINATSSHWGGCHPYTAFAGLRNTRSVYMTDVGVQADGGTPYYRIYDSDDLPPNATSHTFSSTILWGDVADLRIAFDDDLGNYYGVYYRK